MSAGTLTLVNGSDVIVGVGTAFKTTISVGDYIFCKVNGTPYTMPVKSVTTDTDCVVTAAYTGPDATDVPWEFVPQDIMSFISAALGIQSAEAMRQLNNDKDNWLQVYSDTSDNITVRIGNGLTFSGPSWKYITNLLKNMDVDQLQQLADEIHTDVTLNEAIKQAIEASQADVDAKAAQVASDAEQVAADKEQIALDKAAAAQSAADAQQSKEDAAESAEQAAASNPLLALQKSLNLQDLADRAAAWLNVRPIGATPLAADAVGDYDAPTWRQVRNLIESGTTGPTMNGVMNFGVGKPLMHATRAYIPPNELPLDGQLVNRADWPELWAWAQMTSPVSDSNWQTDIALRGGYSTGDGSTTFRLPDWNGVQKSGVNGITGPDSVPNLYFRGTGESAKDMGVMRSAAPNITGTMVIPSSGSSGAWLLGLSYSGAVAPFSTGIGGGYAAPGPGGTGNAGLRLDASKSNAAYGRYSTDTIQTDVVNGVWVVRASGGFVAANTSWSVINADATAPANGTIVKGGKVRSVYKVGTAEYASADLQASVATSSTGVRTVGAEVVVTDATSGTATSKTIKLGTVDGLSGGEIGSTITVRGAGLQPKLVASHLDYNPSLGGNAIWIVEMTGTENILQYVAEVTGQYYSLTTVFRVAGQQQFWSQTSTGRYITPLGELAVQGSDVRIKNDFTPPKSGAWARVEAIGICEFKYKGSDIPQRGFLAQQMGDIDSMYVFTAGKAEDESGKEFDILNVNDRAVMADMIAVIQELQQKVTSMEAEIADLKAK